MMLRLREALLSFLLLVLMVQVVLCQQASSAQARDLIKRGNEKYEREEYQAAIDLYSQIPASSGEVYARAAYNIGVCYYELWRTEDAVAMYEKAIELSPHGYARASYALAVALEDLKRFDEAKKAYRQAIRASGNKYAPAYFKLGVIALNEEDWETATTLFRAAIALSNDQLPSSHNNLGVALARAGKLREAQREFEIAARRKDGARDDARHNLDLCRTLLGAEANTVLISDLRIRE
jgi:tetratricopeptide (TPR) repeat protein